MVALKLILVVGVAVACGLALGAVRGIGAAANEAAEAGLDVPFSNPVLRFLLSPTKNLTFVSTLLFLLLLVVWLPAFVLVVGCAEERSLATGGGRRRGWFQTNLSNRDRYEYEPNAQHQSGST